MIRMRHRTARPVLLFLQVIGVDFNSHITLNECLGQGNKTAAETCAMLIAEHPTALILLWTSCQLCRKKLP